MTQHTPGPWTVDDCPDADGYDTIRLADGTLNGNTEAQPIATAYSHSALIAAAPAMLEALRKLSADAAIFTRTMPESGGSRAHWSEMRRRLINSNTEVQAVIAAAEGK